MLIGFISIVAFHPQLRRAHLRLTQLPEAVGALFSVMAKQGHDYTGAACQKGMKCLGCHEPRIKMLIDTKQWPDYQPLEDWTPATAAALKQLDRLHNSGQASPGSGAGAPL